MRRSVTVLTLAAAFLAALLADIPVDATVQGKNGRIAFRRFLNEAHTWGAIFIINPDGSGERKVTHPRRGVLDDTPDWSPNGRWISFRRDRPGLPTHIFRVHPNGAGLKDLSKSTCHGPLKEGGCKGDRGAAWSPSGRRIAFVRGFDRSKGGPAVFVMRADGTHVHQVTDPVARFQDYGPQWSPDGTHIAFKRYTESECGCPAANHAALFTVRADGAHLRRLTPWSLDGGDEPDYSPNGRWILFGSRECCGEPNNLWAVHPTGKDLHQVTHNAGRQFVWLSSSFSPDGTMIATGRRPAIGDAGNADVYVMNLDGSALRNVTESAAYDSSSDWGPRPR